MNPSPAGQFALLCEAHARVSFSPPGALNQPSAHFEQDASVFAVDIWYSNPAPHEWTETGAHAMVVSLDDHVAPATQSLHLPSLVVVAASRPLPAGHFVVYTSRHESAVLVPIFHPLPTSHERHAPSDVSVAATR